MAKKEEKESIDQLIKKTKKDLEFYNINMNIHNFNIKDDYRKNCDGKELNFVVHKKLVTKNSSNKKRLLVEIKYNHLQEVIFYFMLF